MSIDQLRNGLEQLAGTLSKCVDGEVGLKRLAMLRLANDAAVLADMVDTLQRIEAEILAEPKSVTEQETSGEPEPVVTDDPAAQAESKPEAEPGVVVCDTCDFEDARSDMFRCECGKYYCDKCYDHHRGDCSRAL